MWKLQNLIQVVLSKSIVGCVSGGKMNSHASAYLWTKLKSRKSDIWQFMDKIFRELYLCSGWGQMLGEALRERAEGTDLGLHISCQFHTENSHSLLRKFHLLRERPRVYWRNRAVGGQEVLGKQITDLVD